VSSLIVLNEPIAVIVLCHHWRNGVHFQEQRRVFHQKSEIYWSTAIAICHGDPKKLWHTVNRLLHPVTSLSRAQHSVADLAAHFTTKVEKVHMATIEASPPVINFRQSITLADLAPVSVEEAAKLLKSVPNKNCQLDPYQLGYLKSQLIALLHSLRHFATPTHLVCHPLRNMPCIS